jgi:hypothetical protein
MRLDLIYFLAIFVLPSIARTHQSISHKFMAFGDKVSAINPRQLPSHRAYVLDTERFCRV